VGAEFEWAVGVIARGRSPGAIQSADEAPQVPVRGPVGRCRAEHVGSRRVSRDYDSVARRGLEDRPRRQRSTLDRQPRRPAPTDAPAAGDRLHRGPAGAQANSNSQLHGTRRRPGRRRSTPRDRTRTVPGTLRLRRPVEGPGQRRPGGHGNTPEAVRRPGRVRATRCRGSVRRDAATRPRRGPAAVRSTVAASVLPGRASRRAPEPSRTAGYLSARRRGRARSAGAPARE
jgi:hypothetical protein